MPIIKDNTLVEDHWVYLDDDAPLPDIGDIVVSLDRWQKDRAELIARRGRIGLRLRSDESARAIGQEAQQFALIAIEFPKFKDGRGYSSARLLRERFGYQGELRAVGEVLRDQYLFMARCGIDSFDVSASDPLEAWLHAQTEFSVVYQSAADSRPSVLALRHRITSAA